MDRYDHLDVDVSHATKPNQDNPGGPEYTNEFTPYSEIRFREVASEIWREIDSCRQELESLPDEIELMAMVNELNAELEEIEAEARSRLLQLEELRETLGVDIESIEREKAKIQTAIAALASMESKRIKEGLTRSEAFENRDGWEGICESIDKPGDQGHAHDGWSSCVDALGRAADHSITWQREREAEVEAASVDINAAIEILDHRHSELQTRRAELSHIPKKIEDLKVKLDGLAKEGLQLVAIEAAHLRKIGLYELAEGSKTDTLIDPVYELANKAFSSISIEGDDSPIEVDTESVSSALKLIDEGITSSYRATPEGEATKGTGSDTEMIDITIAPAIDPSRVQTTITRGKGKAYRVVRLGTESRS